MFFFLAELNVCLIDDYIEKLFVLAGVSGGWSYSDSRKDQRLEYISVKRCFIPIPNETGFSLCYYIGVINLSRKIFYVPVVVP